jgi:hypothetical protein
MNSVERTTGNAPEAEPSVETVRVQILADALIYEGFVSLGSGARIQEELNDPRPFLNLTEAVIQDRNSASASHAPFVALNKGAITHVVLLTAEAVAREGAKPASTPSVSAQAIAAARPTVPPAGPRTLPGPPPPPRSPLGDPPTQPFPRLHGGDSVGELILDDDGGDDIDPDDLERDGGAFVAGAAGAE